MRIIPISLAVMAMSLFLSVWAGPEGQTQSVPDLTPEKSEHLLIAPNASVSLDSQTKTMTVALSLSRCTGGLREPVDDDLMVAVNTKARKILVFGAFRYEAPTGPVPKFCKVNPDNPKRVFTFENIEPGEYEILYERHRTFGKLGAAPRVLKGAQQARVELSVAKPIRAIQPGRMRISQDETGQALRVEVTYPRCKSDFAYDHNTLELDLDRSDRSIGLTGSVNYTDPVPGDETACSTRPEPLVFTLEDYEPEAYVIKNVSAWMGRGGNGIDGRVIDFRTPERVEQDKQDCLAQDGSDIGDISGIWFLQSDPSMAMSLSGGETTLVPEAILRTWVGSTMPWIIEADAPYTFKTSSFGSIEFRSPSCALVYSPLTGEQIDFLFRQTPENP
ncbi:MAG: hypothetical protein AAGI14_08010 [Pseudomonadota bacterium]